MTNSDEIGLKEWSTSLQSAYKCSNELFSGLAKKAGKIYGADGIATSHASNAGNNVTSTSGPTSSLTHAASGVAASAACCTNPQQSSSSLTSANAT